MDIIRALEGLKKLEYKVYELYMHYHKLFVSDKKASGVFFELALEEKSHADLIDYQLRTIRKNRGSYKDVDFDIESMAGFVEKIDAGLSSKEPPDLKEALNFSIALEGDALEGNYMSLIAGSNKELAEVVQKLGASEKGHFEKLAELSRR